MKNAKDDEKGIYIRLSDFKGGMEVQRQKVLEAISDKACDYTFDVNAENFTIIPGMPIAYWVNEKVTGIYNKSVFLGNVAEPKQGIATANNERFLRLWHEVEYNNCFFDCDNAEQSGDSDKKWYPYNKGGEFRKWYGNNDYVIDWHRNGQELRRYKGAVLRNPSYYFKKCISWSLVTSGSISFRYKPKGHLFDVAGMCCFINEDYFNYLLFKANK